AKALARIALTVMPRQELEFFTDTVEWVSNPDHDFDDNLFMAPQGHVFLLDQAIREPWLSVVRRTDDDAPMPYLLLYLATASAVVQAVIPLCTRDDGFEKEDTIVPMALPPSPNGDHLEPRQVAPVVPAVPRRAKLAR